MSEQSEEGGAPPGAPAAPAPAADATSRPPRRAAGSSRWRLPISAVLAIGFGGLVALAAGSVLFLSLDVAQQNTNELLRETAENEIAQLVDGLAHHLGPARDQVVFAAAQLETGAVPVDAAQRLEDLLLGTLAAAPQVTGIAYVRPDLSAVHAGREAGSYGTGTANWFDRPEIRLGMRTAPTAEGFAWGEPVFIETMQNTFLAPRRTVRVRGEFQGIVTAIVSLTELSDFLIDTTVTLGGVRFVLYGRDHVLAHPSLVHPGDGLDLPPLSAGHPLPSVAEIGDPVLSALWQAPVDTLSGILGDSQVRGRVIEVGGVRYVVLYREIHRYGEVPWTVGVHFRADTVNAPILRLVVAAAVGLAILVISVLLALLLGRAIARPVRRLAEAADAVRDLQTAGLAPLPRSPLRELDSAALAFNSMITGLRWFATYVPRSLVGLLMRRGVGELVSEERALTVLFTDMIGFSAISQRLNPPQLADFLNRHFALLAACIEAEGGTLDKYIGDSVMAFWGAPERQDDHAAAACRAAARIAAALHGDNERRLAKGLRPVRVRIGIHSGPAIAGNIGAPGRVNYTLIGDTVNTAQRLEQLGKEVDDGVADAVVLVSGVTAAQIPQDALLPLGPHALRGRAEEIEVYRLG